MIIINFTTIVIYHCPVSVYVNGYTSVLNSSSLSYLLMQMLSAALPSYKYIPLRIRMRNKIYSSNSSRFMDVRAEY